MAASSGTDTSTASTFEELLAELSTGLSATGADEGRDEEEVGPVRAHCDVTHRTFQETGGSSGSPMRSILSRRQRGS